MKKIFLILILGSLGLTGFSQTVTNNFEGGNWNYYFNACWGIGPNSSFFGTKVTANSSQGFNGSFVCETDNLGQKPVCHLESPWINLVAGNISFDHVIPSFNGTRTLKVFAIKSGTNASTQLGGTISYTNSTPISTSIPVNLTGIYKIQWQWEGSGGNSRGQLDNIKIPGTNVSNPSDDCNPVTPPPPDTDSDGVDNNEDQYVVEPTKAYNIYYPASDTSTLAFEDHWPSYGDYDMNDMVMGYKFKIVTNGQNQVVEMFATLILRANGADNDNGFGFQLPNVKPASIVSVTGTGDQTGYSIGTNGTETGNPTKATFIVFGNAHQYMPDWNTLKKASKDPEHRFNLHIVFLSNGTPGSNGDVTLNNLNIAQWNPFIVVKGDRGREVHLPNHPPTELANPSYFGAADDNTNPGKGNYYKSKTNLPWALDFSGTFNYPIESQDINSCYHYFEKWVQSNGNQYTDWWSKNSSGYRDSSKIY